MPSRSYRLKRKESPSDGVRRIGVRRVERALAALDAAERGELASGVHAARKDLKKTRALLRLVREALGEDAYRAENRRYRDAGRLLARSRDAEAKLETLDALSAHDGELPPASLKRWREALAAERDEAAGDDAGNGPGGIGRARNAIEVGRTRIRAWDLGPDSWDLFEPGLTRSYERGRKAMRRAAAKPSTENVHAWRKRAKDLWYQLRIVRGAWPGPLGATADEAHALADLLGDHHDLAVLGADLASREGLRRRDAFAEAIDRRQEQLLGDALELGAHLYAEKPKAFRRRLRRYWLAWRGR